MSQFRMVGLACDAVSTWTEEGDRVDYYGRNASGAACGEEFTLHGGATFAGREEPGTESRLDDQGGGYGQRPPVPGAHEREPGAVSDDVERLERYRQAREWVDDEINYHAWSAKNAVAVPDAQQFALAFANGTWGDGDDLWAAWAAFKQHHSRYVLHDLVEQPDFNPASQNDRGDWSLRDVTAGTVYRAADGKPACVDHGAMNCVAPTLTIWRCLMCGRAAYTTKEK